MFNYYVFYDNNTLKFIDYGCSCPDILYPKLIFIFYKGGRNKDILTLYDRNGYTSIKNFSIDGYDQKKYKIFNLFGISIYDQFMISSLTKNNY
jgi:hypothetical protein